VRAPLKYDWLMHDVARFGGVNSSRQFSHSPPTPVSPSLNFSQHITMASIFNQRTPTGLVIAQTIGITASAYLLGEYSQLWQSRDRTTHKDSVAGHV
jgi:hypothetical protein